MEKSRDFQLFMTQNDEQQFCEELRGYNPNIFFWIFLLLRKLTLAKDYIRLL